jgi:hypothetical protein
MKLIATLALTASMASATIIIPDTYPGTGGDVIGDLDKFDIKQVKLLNNNANRLTIQIDFNYGNGNTSLAPFSFAGLNLNVGDLLFDIGNNGSWDFGGVVHGHGNTPGSTTPLVAGGFYSVGTVLTAFDVLNYGCLTCYRPDEEVWMKTDAKLFASGTVSPNGGGSATAPSTEFSTIYDVTFAGNNPLANQEFALHFAAATCGNDVIDGVIPAPEPATWALGGAALGALGLARRFRRA